MNRFAALLRVELGRLRARRAVLLILLAAVVVPLVVAVGVVLSTSAPSAGEVAEAERQAAAAADSRFVQRDLRQCLERPGRYGIPPDVRSDPAALQATCEEFAVPSVDSYLYVNRLDLDDEREFGSGVAVVAILGALAFLAGTTFAGHDWATGSMSNQLLFEPRRVRVWAAKALALLVSSAVVSLVVLAAYWLGLYAVVQGRGEPVGDGALLDCLQHGGRGVAIAAVAALGGYALTMLSRSTVFSLGLLFAVSVAGGLLLVAIGPDDRGPVDPTINALAVVQDGTEYYVDPPERCYSGRGGFDDSDPACFTARTRTLQQGAIYYGVLLGVVGVASAGSFRRRDVP